MIKNTPPMGWNSWNTFGNDISEELIMKTADVMVNEGFLDAGYEYLVIDDCWSMHERDKDGKLVADPVKFPHGMKYVADYVHSKGLKFGMYSCAGPVTCANFPGSFDHEFVDAKTFAEWGVDFLKYDYCFRPFGVAPDHFYKRMGLALATCGRDILFSACSWGADDTKNWIKEANVHMWRSTGDIFDNFDSIKFIAQSQIKVAEYNGLGCFNDMDMLVVGMNGKGNVGRGGCNYDEYFTHFAFWCLYGSPLMIGCDIRDMDPEIKKMLFNKDLIRINQDKKYNTPFVINTNRKKNEKLSNENPFYYETGFTDIQIIAKYLDDGKIAIGCFNFADYDSNYVSTYFPTFQLGLPETSGKTLKMRDVITGEEFVIKNGYFSTNLKAHCTKMYIAEVIDK